MTSMTYGTMPTREQFAAAFDREVTGKGRPGYGITLSYSDSRAVDNYRLGDGLWRCDELYDSCVEIAADAAATDRALDLVSTIMHTLGFEWI